MGLPQIKKLLHIKEIINRMKRQPTELEKSLPAIGQVKD
jgi:hypothetical protein